MSIVAIVKIVKASIPSLWYADHIGEVFAVINLGSPTSSPDHWDVIGDERNVRSIANFDCQELKQTQPVALGNRADTERMTRDEERRTKQLEVNELWLLQCTDEICYALCPDFIGTWQERAKAAVKAAKRIANP